METILAHAQGLVYTLLNLMPTLYQHDSLQVVVGQWRVPWSFRVYRGKNTLSPAQLGL